MMSATLFSSPAPERPSDFPDWEDVPDLVAAIASPRIPDREYAVEDFGAVGDGVTNDRPAIMSAIARAASVGGGRVVLGSGRTWFSKGPVSLKSNIELHVAQGATLRFSADPDDYLPQVLTRWEGTEVFNYSPLIHAYMASNVALTGGGTIDGNAEEVFGTWRRHQRPAQRRLREMGAEQVPVFKRVFGPGDFLRPSMVQFLGCSRVLVEDVRIVDSPFWVLHFVSSDQAIVRGVTVESPRLNNDGVDIESTSDVLIENSRFITGDDSIVIKAGRDADGRRLSRPSERVVIRNNYMEGHNALAIGSEMSGGVRHVFMENNELGEVRSPLYFKSSTLRGGMIENVRIRDITVRRSHQPLIRFVKDYQGQTGGEHIPVFRDIHIENVVAGRVGGIFQFRGNPDEPIRDVRIRNVAIAEVDLDDEELEAALVIDAEANHLHAFVIENVTVGGRSVNMAND